MRIPKSFLSTAFLLIGVIIIGQTPALQAEATGRFDLQACYEMCESVYNACVDLCPPVQPPDEPPCEFGCRMDQWMCDINCIPAPPPPPEESYFPRSYDVIIYYDQLMAATVSFGRYYMEDFLAGPGTVSRVDIYYIALENYNTSIGLYENDFIFAGEAEYNANSNSWNGPIGFSKAGFGEKYIVRADFHDPSVPGGMVSGCIAAIPPPSGVIPTMTEWGLIIFSVLLLGWMAWVIVRRRKTAALRI